MESAPGDSLHLSLDDPKFPGFCYSAGRLLHKIHSVPTRDLPVYAISDELANLKYRSEKASELFPSHRAAFTTAFDRLLSHKPDDNHPRACVHRDFYDKQVLHSQGRITLLDYDNMAVSDPALDFGNFSAHLWLRKLQEPSSARLIDGGLKMFEKGYEDADNKYKRRAEWWRGAALIRLAALYLFRPRWRSIAVKLLSEADNYRYDEILSGEKI